MKKKRWQRWRRRQRTEVVSSALPLRYVAPNLVTMCAACCGMTSITFSVQGLWEYALLALIISCVCDFLDGCVARALKAESKIGAELDSLADFVDFGVAPGMFMYYWLTAQVNFEDYCITKHLILMLSLFYAMSCAFRLARYNSMLDQPSDPRWKHYFMGVPAPGGCYMLLTPVLLWLGFGDKTNREIFCNPYVGAAMLFIVGALMVSQIPTLALKHIRLPKSIWLVILAMLIPAFAVLHFWITLGVVGALYFLTIPVCAFFFLREFRNSKSSHSLSSAVVVKKGDSEAGSSTENTL